MADIHAVVFDSYGTLLDVHAAMRRFAPKLGPDWQQISQEWRSKQLQYSWVRGLAGQYRDFWRLTEEALEAAAAKHGVTDRALLADVLQAYHALDAFPDVVPALRRLHTAGKRCAVLSNGAPEMLDRAVRHADLDGLLEAVISVDPARSFKPDPHVYQLACDRLGCPAAALAFVTANAWDAFGGACFGFRVFWLNRNREPVEYGLDRCATEIGSLDALPDALA